MSSRGGKSTTSGSNPVPGKPRSIGAALSGWVWFGGSLALTLVTAGLLAWVPFVHAAIRMRSAALGRRAAIYAGLAVLVVILVAVTPSTAQGDPIGTTSGLLSTLMALMAVAMMITAVVQQWSLRRTLFPAGSARTRTRADAEAASNPAVAGILAARARRDQARELAAEDPLMARELRIGRPDLARTYDDGGLVDLNSAPAAVIAHICELDPADADAIVTAREHHGSGLSNIDELLVLAEMPMHTWEVIRDRAVLIAT
ncbi:helix-hairpin-helix domain-containing protein [Haloactinomyces albus]|uniref:DNA uptake protein ComE-like DNA-binding protein n=1 Tax=Haloactinomyces albus TaxID=1352928 RepID=A0AAE4CKZ5_9ACTN|nr:hypothetical protein [Haloactinomyces albus]MDR7300851.1 DNA uptake protein ComE-like DNA-binding protein [Haloactinomyces albus]